MKRLFLTLAVLLGLAIPSYACQPAGFRGFNRIGFGGGFGINQGFALGGCGAGLATIVVPQPVSTVAVSSCQTGFALGAVGGCGAGLNAIGAGYGGGFGFGNGFIGNGFGIGGNRFLFRNRLFLGRGLGVNPLLGGGLLGGRLGLYGGLARGAAFLGARALGLRRANVNGRLVARARRR